MKTVHPVILAFCNNEITLNEAREAFGYPLESLPLGMKYHAELTPPLEIKEVSPFEEFLFQLELLLDLAIVSFEKAYRQILQDLKLDAFGEKKALDETNKIYELRSMAIQKIYSLKDQFQYAFVKHALTHFKSTALIVNEKLVEQYGEAHEVDVDALHLKFLKEILPKETESFAKGRIQYFRQKINDLAVQELDKEKPSSAQFMEAAKQVIEQAEKNAKTVAKTEMVKLTNLVTIEVSKAAGMKWKTWIAETEGCPLCKTLHGQTFPLEDAFYQKGVQVVIFDMEGKKHTVSIEEDLLYPPAHPNCKCFILPHLEVDELDVSEEDEEEEERDSHSSTDPAIFQKLAIPSKPGRLFSAWGKGNESLRVIPNLSVQEWQQLYLQQRECIHRFDQDTVWLYEEDYNKLRHFNAERIAERMKEKDPAFYERFVEFAREMKRQKKFTDYNYRGDAEYGIGGIWEAWNAHYNYHVTSRTIQRILKEEWGRTESNLSFEYFRDIFQEEFAEDDPYRKEWGDVLKGFIQFQYEYTQEYFDAYFRSKGIYSLMLFRGEKVEHYDAENFRPGLATVNNRHILNALSSFTLNPKKTSIFASGKYARLYAASIPLERILAFYHTGYGVYHEEEWLVLGPSQKGDQFFTWDWGKEDIYQFDLEDMFRVFSDLSRRL